MREDIELIDQYIAGDDAAVEQLIRRYQKMVYSFAYKMVNNMEDAKDITQNTFIKAIFGLKKFKKRSSFKTWLYRIAVNTSLNHIRKGGYREVELNESLCRNQAGSLSFIIQKEKRDSINKSLDQLPKQQRLAVILRAYEGLSCNQASQVMECSEGAVKAHYHFGIKKLRELLSGPSDKPDLKGQEL